MRRTAMTAALLLSSCATTQPPSSEPAAPVAATAPATPALAPSAAALKPVTVEFASATATKAGEKLTETRYSEKPDDVAITAKTFADGVITILGNVGTGKGSSYGGIGLNFSIYAGGKPIDARGYRAVTFRLASTTTHKLRVRISGANREKRDGGCYPVYMQAVGPELKSYTIPFEKFEAESWCGSKAEPVTATLGDLAGYEVADITVSKDPTSFSIGPITLEP